MLFFLATVPINTTSVTLFVSTATNPPQTTTANTASTISTGMKKALQLVGFHVSKRRFFLLFFSSGSFLFDDHAKQKAFNWLKSLIFA